MTRIYVENLADRNKGDLRGGWLPLPASDEAIQQFMDDVVGLNEVDEFGQPKDEYAVIDMELDSALAKTGFDDWLAKNGEGECLPISQWNMVATASCYLSDEDGLHVRAALEQDPYEKDVDSFCSMMLQADDIPFYGYGPAGMEGSTPEESFGYHVADELADDLKVLETHGLSSYFDFESYGRNQARDMQAILYDNGYLDCSQDMPGRLDHEEILEGLNDIGTEAYFETARDREMDDDVLC